MSSGPPATRRPRAWKELDLREECRMAKGEKLVCASYADMENLMVRMDALDREISAERVEMDEALKQADAIKGRVDERMKKRKAMVDAMETYAITRKGLDFTGEGQSLREKRLKRGVVGFRLAPPAIKSLSRDWTEARIIEAMKELVRRDAEWKKHAQAQLIRVKESLNKDAIRDAGLSAEALAKCGLTISQEDLFWAKTACEMEAEEVERKKGEKAA